MVNVSLEGVRKSFGAVEILHGIDLEIRSGEFVVFVGPSGCGKSTMLRAIAGLEEISAGVLKIGDVVVNKVPPANRGIAMVFQSYALYPHMTVFENMAFGLKISRLPKETIRQKVNAAAALLQLTPYLDRLPRHLSGGQRQRVAIGRAITRDPKVFLFDEPLSNLDAALRVATRIEIANLKETLPDTTMIYVTHDQVEAMTLADRIVVFNAGQIEQIGTPLELYHAPSNLFVAQFIGSPAMNIMPASTSAGAATFSASGKVDSRSKVVRAPEGGHLGIRPEHIVLGDPDHAAIKGTVVLTEELGEFTIAHIDIGSDTYLIAKFDETAKLRKGDRVGLEFPPERVHVFGADGHAIVAKPVSAVA